MSLEHDIREAARGLLDATGEFSAVWLPGLDDPRGKPASELLFCGIEPGTTRAIKGFDSAETGGWVYEMRTPLEIEVRHIDPQIRDDTADRLLNVVRDTLNGDNLGSLAMPQKTFVTDWRWQKAHPPGRRITATLVCWYSEEGWQGADTSQDF